MPKSESLHSIVPREEERQELNTSEGNPIKVIAIEEMKTLSP